MIKIIDCGSQYNQNIARRVRENNVYCEILPYNASLDNIISENLEGIIITGGPASVYDDGPLYNKEVFNLNIPILGICYGMQSMIHLLGGKVSKAKKREYGKTILTIDNNLLFKNIPKESVVWMSHTDVVTKLPPGFKTIAQTKNSLIAALYNPKKELYAVQFHPEVDNTEYGREILSNFLDICKCEKDWTTKNFIETAIKDIKAKCKNKKVVGGLSGGVDSSVASLLMHKAIGKNYIPVFINNGLLRKGEAEQVIKNFKEHLKTNLRYVNASKRFIKELEGISEPEQKRKIIGNLFIKIFEEEAKKVKNAEYLMQGTLYPDFIESMPSYGGPSSTIKSHHNVGGLPEKMNLKLVEPLKYLFKDEVRKIGKELGLPTEIVNRHPFPGPGLAVRILGEVTEEKLDILRKADAIFIEEIKKVGLYDEIWQAFAGLISQKTVGVMGDERTYSYPIVLRAITSQDGMTADWYKFKHDLLGKISNRIINEVKGVNRVFYDIGSKPPETIELE